ncbi:MAG TPA: glycosyltransferase family 4 protein [Caldisericia bacterium]|nr:glycosyltransferase family 4 protein [Caldisericia bacterium]
MLNIWFISKYGACPPKYTKGGRSRLFYLAQEMRKIGNQVILITSDSNHFSNFPKTKKTYNNDTEDDVPFKWIRTIKYKKTVSILRVLSWLDFELKLFLMPLKSMVKPDVVIISSLSIFSIVYGNYLKKKFNCFLVFEIRDIWPLAMTEEGGFSKNHPLVRFIGMIEKFGYKKADLIVGTFPKLDMHVKNILGYDRPFFCSPQGFDPEKYNTDEEIDTSMFQNYVHKDRVIIGYAGSIGISNSLQLFIDTIKLMKDDSDIYFLIVGSGDLKHKYEEELAGYHNVVFLHRIEQDKVKCFLSICDIVYLSTNDSKFWKFGQSLNKIVEYMLAGKPIIATYTGYPSMINEANCGVFVPSKNPEDLRDVFISYAHFSKKERENIGKKGRDWIYQHRTYEMLAKDYLQKINSMIVKN